MQNSEAFLAAMKPTMLSDSLENSVFVGSDLLDEFTKVTPTAENGEEARVVVRTGLSGGYSAVPRTGSSELNEGTAVATKQAVYKYAHNWFDVIVDSGVIDESSSSSLAVAKAVETERAGAVDSVKRQLQRGLFGDGTAKICLVNDTEGNSHKVVLGADGFDRARAGQIYKGLKVDIGTAEAEDSIVASREIEAVEIDKANEKVTLTLSGAEFDTLDSTTHFLSIANARDGATSFEVAGLLAMVSETTVYGEIDPAEVPGWSASVDSTAQDVSLDLLYELEGDVYNSSGEEPDWALTAEKQQSIIIRQLQAQARFGGNEAFSAGKRGEGVTMPNGTVLKRHFDCLDRCLFMLHKKSLGTVRSKDGPTWADPQMLQYVPGTTHFRGALRWLLNTALLRRNTLAAATQLN